MSKPKVFEHAFRLAPDDIIRMGHVKNCAQDAALTHESRSASGARRRSGLGGSPTAGSPWRSWEIDPDRRPVSSSRETYDALKVIVARDQPLGHLPTPPIIPTTLRAINGSPHADRSREA